MEGRGAEKSCGAGITVNDLMHSVTLKGGLGVGSGSIRAKSTPDMPPGIDERGSSSTSAGFCGSMGVDLPSWLLIGLGEVPDLAIRANYVPTVSVDGELCDREPSVKFGGEFAHLLKASAKSGAAIDLTFGTKFVFEGAPSGVPLVPVSQLPVIFDVGVGPTFVRSKIDLVSDQRDFGGERDTASKSEWLAGLAVKGGASTPVGTVPGAPVLAGVETTFRFLPSQKVAVESSAFTERVKVDGRMENTTGS